MKKIIFFLLLSISAFAQNKHIKIPIAGGLGSNSADTGITSITIVPPASGFDVTPTVLTNPGTFTFSLTNDLMALENLSTTGIPVRTAANTWALRNITGTGGIAITNNGLTGNIVIDGSAIGGGGGGTTDLTWSGITAGGATLNSSTGTDVILNVSGALSVSGAAGGITITNTFTESQFLSWNSIAVGSANLAITPGANLPIIAGSNVFFTNTGGNLTINSSGAGGGGVTGSGTSNFVTKWTSTATIGNAIIQDNGSTIGIGTAPNASYLTQWPNGDLRVGLTSSTTNRVFFGDGTFVSVGEEGADDRLYLRGSSMSMNINGSTGSAGQVPTATGAGTFTWQTNSSIQTLSWSSISSSTGTLAISGGNNISLLAGTNVTFANVGGNVRIDAASGSGGSFSTSGSLITSISGITGSVQFVAGANMTITNSGTSGNAVLNFAAAGGGGSTDLTWGQISNTAYLFSSSGADVTMTIGAGLNLSSSPPTSITISAVDQLVTNEGLLSVSGTTTRTISSNTSGSNSPAFTGAGIVTVGGSGSAITITGTEAQTLSLVSNTLTISGTGSSVSLAGYVNTDGQTLSLASNTLSISGGNNVSLSGYVDTWNLGANASYTSITNGTNVNFVGTGTVSTSRSGSTITINGTGGIGTVTSVGLSVPSGMSVSNTPITGAGTISIAVTSLEVMPSGLSSSQVVFIDGGSTLAGNNSFTYNSGTATLTTDKQIITGTATGSGYTLPLKFSAMTGNCCGILTVDTNGNVVVSDGSIFSYSASSGVLNLVDDFHTHSQVRHDNLSVFADNAAASSLAVGVLYRTPTGQLMVRY